ncbi:hypothetical protein ULMS_05670 [Patiriisocius marinistellae]|uniref:Uncharacterized protein n=1 Tax=Patiriisocius marinistellae TaxID=2494560 RepID=A0A5J4FY45_9FLAO|nr:hypothetical protein [Patiriisocius marinistellae]GEQ85059.1 hypothetical protein ULMS_05670 [Patiriisocius marinistellae]
MGKDIKKVKPEFKKECCEKYLKKGEHKRCKRCPCFDMDVITRKLRFTQIKTDKLLKKNF